MKNKSSSFIFGRDCCVKRGIALCTVLAGIGGLLCTALWGVFTRFCRRFLSGCKSFCRVPKRRKTMQECGSQRILSVKICIGISKRAMLQKSAACLLSSLDGYFRKRRGVRSFHILRSSASHAAKSFCGKEKTVSRKSVK